MKTVEITIEIEDTSPIPRDGDLFITINSAGVEKEYILHNCTCTCCKDEGWPNGNICGAHMWFASKDSGLIAFDAPSKRWLRAGRFIPMSREVPIKSERLSICPLCSSPGEDLVFKFYCSCSECRNFHP